MPNIALVEPNEASLEVAEVYTDFERRMGFSAPPNFIKTQGHSLAAARSSTSLVDNLLVEGKLPRALKEMLFVAISHERGCRSCEAAHIACCRMLGVDAATMAKVAVAASELTPARSGDIIRFGLKCARDPQSLGVQDFEVLRAHGLSEGEIVEVIAVSGLAVYASIMADATGVESDETLSGT